MKNLQSIRSLAGLIAIVLTSVSVGGCIYIQPPVETVPPDPIPVETTPTPPTRVAEPAAVARPEPPPPPAPAPAPPQRTVLLLSDDIPEFTTIADEIEQRTDAEYLTILNLDGSPANISRAMRESEGADQIIAIGLLAATVGLEIDGARLVFCQVFNYRDYGLISASSKGVKLLPPFELQLQRWTALDPDLHRIGILTGPNQDDVIGEARAAAERNGIELTVRNVSSDKEALYTYRLLAPDIDGLWLLPDNRILSPEVVREIMAYSAQYRKQVVVFGANLLGAGGLMSVTSDAADVAEQVLARLGQVSADGRLEGPDMRPLTKLHIEINPEIARHLGLDATQTLAAESVGR